jgi:hypothetical protein
MFIFFLSNLGMGGGWGGGSPDPVVCSDPFAAEAEPCAEFDPFAAKAASCPCQPNS